jgi:hypothetical protein
MPPLHRAALRSWAEREQVAHPPKVSGVQIWARVTARHNSQNRTMICIKGMPTIMAKVNDRGSFLNQRGGWDPYEGVRLDNGDPIVTIGDFLKFARVAFFMIPLIEPPQ